MTGMLSAHYFIGRLTKAAPSNHLLMLHQILRLRALNDRYRVYHLDMDGGVYGRYNFTHNLRQEVVICDRNWDSYQQRRAEWSQALASAESVVYKAPLPDGSWVGVVGTMDKSVGVASDDVIRLILQFLKENKLMKSLLMLQEESGVSLNSVPSVDSLVADAQMGRWNQVLDAVDTMKLSQETLFKLFDQIVRELVDLKESKLATSMLENATPLREMEREEPENYRILADLCRKRPTETREIYAGPLGVDSQKHLTKDKRRAIVAEALKKDIDSVPPSRLTALIGMAMKWQQHVGVISNYEQFDVFRNTSTSSTKGVEPSVKEVAKIINFAEKSHPECAIFTPNGQYLISGSSDGFIEVWNWKLGQLDPDLEYQQKDQFMVHETLIVSLAVSRDSEILASGDKDGHIKVWKIATGECMRKMNHAHEGAVTCMTFSMDSTTLLTGSFDRTARIHGLKSGKPLKLFKGHSSIVNAAIYSYDGTKVITGSSDGYVKIWDSRTTDLLKSFLAFTAHDPSSRVSSDAPRPINSILNMPYNGSDELIMVCTRSSSLSVYKLSGICVKHYSIEDAGNNFLDVAISRRLNWVYAVGEGNMLYCFNKAGNLEHSFKVHEKDVIGLVHHPQESVIASWGLDGTIKLLYP